MRGLAVAAALALTALFPMESRASLFDGNELHQLCHSRDGDEQALCMTYIMGVYDGVSASQATDSGGQKICPEKKVTAFQMIDIVKKWLENNPSKRHLMGSVIIKLTLEKHLPCK